MGLNTRMNESTGTKIHTHVHSTYNESDVAGVPPLHDRLLAPSFVRCTVYSQVRGWVLLLNWCCLSGLMGNWLVEAGNEVRVCTWGRVGE